MASFVGRMMTRRARRTVAMRVVDEARRARDVASMSSGRARTTTARESGVDARGASGRRAATAARERALWTRAEGAPGANRGPVGWMSLALVSLTGAGVLVAYDAERTRRLEAHKRNANQATNGFQTVVAGGKAAVGGAFSLVDAKTGKVFTEKDLRGSFSMVYFGFTHCPDVCPDELEKVAAATTAVNARLATSNERASIAVRPVFITIDPSRDDKKRVREYVREFHPDMVGLTGSEKACEDAARKYRVYYRKTGDEKATSDYLVDHSIITYLMNPDGDFVTFYGKNTTEKEVAESVYGHVSAWLAERRDAA